MYLLTETKRLSYLDLVTEELDKIKTSHKKARVIFKAKSISTDEYSELESVFFSKIDVTGRNSILDDALDEMTKSINEYLATIGDKYAVSVRRVIHASSLRLDGTDGRLIKRNVIFDYVDADMDLMLNMLDTFKLTEHRLSNLIGLLDGGGVGTQCILSREENDLLNDLENKYGTE